MTLSLIWNSASLFEKQGHLEVKWQKSKHLHAGGRMYLNRMSYCAFNADNYMVLSVECNFISICYPPSFFVVAVVESPKIKTYP